MHRNDTIAEVQQAEAYLEHKNHKMESRLNVILAYFLPTYFSPTLVFSFR